MKIEAYTCDRCGKELTRTEGDITYGKAQIVDIIVIFPEKRVGRREYHYCVTCAKKEFRVE